MSSCKRPDLDFCRDDGLRLALERVWDRYDALSVSPDPRELARRREVDEGLARDARMRALVSRGVPSRIATLIAEGSLRPSQALSVVEASKKAVVILSGIAGAGRSVAAAAMVAKVGELGRFIRAFDLVALRADQYGDRLAIREIEGAKVLAIDDLGLETVDQRYLALLEQVIRRRFDDGKRTVITTGLPKPKFVERYGRRLVEQISPDGQFEEIVKRFEDVAEKPAVAQLSLVN